MKKTLLVVAVSLTLAVVMFAAKADLASNITKRIDIMNQKIDFATKPPPAKPCSLPMSDAELRKILSPEQYRIMRKNGTELPFRNAYWNNKKAGLYVDAISGEPLFSSTDKFDSGTGWPSFTAPVKKDGIIEKPDTSHGMNRTEVRARKSDSHLGHVFPDGPGPAGLRYCVNSAALRFIPVDQLEKEGYEDYLSLFQNNTAPKAALPKKTETAVFGAGCFWGVEAAFRQVEGVVKTTVGYMGGHTKHPTYRDVCTDKTGHAEVVEVVYDPKKITYPELLDIFWNIHDPTTPDRQGPDIGTQYRSVIFYETSEQQKVAALSLQKAGQTGQFRNKIVTEISPAGEFWKAEDYHQNYFEQRGIKPTCHLPQKYLAKK